MTYDLTIGEKYSEVEDGDVIEGAKHLELPAAPCFPGAMVSAHQNEINIPWFNNAYRNFRHAILQTDPALADKLCTGSNDRTLIPIDATLIVSIEKVVANWKRLNPDMVPAFNDEPESSPTLARLEVLEWWAKYALLNFGEAAVIAIS